MPDDELLLRVLVTLEDHGRRIAAIEKKLRDMDEYARQWLEHDEAESKRLNEATERRPAAGPRP